MAAIEFGRPRAPSALRIAIVFQAAIFLPWVLKLPYAPANGVPLAMVLATHWLLLAALWHLRGLAVPGMILTAVLSMVYWRYWLPYPPFGIGRTSFFFSVLYRLVPVPVALACWRRLDWGVESRSRKPRGSARPRLS